MFKCWPILQMNHRVIRIVLWMYRPLLVYICLPVAGMACEFSTTLHPRISHVNCPKFGSFCSELIPDVVNAENYDGVLLLHLKIVLTPFLILSCVVRSSITLIIKFLSPFVQAYFCKLLVGLRLISSRYLLSKYYTSSQY